MSSFLSSFYILEISPLPDVGLVKIFSHCVGCHSYIFIMPFGLQELYNIMRSHSLVVALNVCAAGVIFGNGLLCNDIMKFAGKCKDLEKSF